MHRNGALVAFISLVSIRAEAALTDSEKMQIATFVQRGVASNAGRVRALVARPDLTAEEAAEALKKGFVSVPFDDVRQRFADALLFGPGSTASRNALVPPVVEALLARAAVRMGDVPAEPRGALAEPERRAADEATAIHAFIDRRIANFGTPPLDGHDGSSAIRDDAWRAAALAEKAHRDAHARWLSGGTGPTPAEIVRLRAQSAVTLIDLASGVVGRSELSAWLGLEGARRDAFERHGVLVESSAPDARAAAALRTFEAAPDALTGVSLILLSKTSPAGVFARGAVAHAGATFEPPLRRESGDRIWADEVTPSEPDAALFQVAEIAALRSVHRAFENRPELRERGRAASDRAASTGPLGYLAKDVVGRALEGDAKLPRAPASPEMVIAGAAQLLLVDAERALDLALIRASEGHPQPLEQSAAALAVLAGGGARASLGRTESDGSIEPDPATEIHVEEGVATGFVLHGKHYAVLAQKGGAFQATVDGAPPKLTSLASFRERTAEGSAFRASNVEFTTLFGAPRGASLDDGRVVLDGGKGGFDALATGPVLSDGEVRARVRPSGAGGGLLLRASAGDASYAAVALLLSADPGKVRLLTFNGRGKAYELADEAPLPSEVPAAGYDVSLRIVGTSVRAAVGNETIGATLNRDVAPGKAGLAVLAGGRIEVHDFKSVPCEPPSPAKGAGRGGDACVKPVTKGAR